MPLFRGSCAILWASTFPITVNTDVMIPDQAAMIKQYKGRLKKMQAAQRDSHGGYRIDVDAQVAQRQLIETLENLISSSLKTCRTSMVIGVRTSQPVQSHRDLAEQERVLSDRRQKVLYTVMQMNGSRGLPEDLAKRRLFIGGLPGMSEENQRENDCLTVHAADLLPMETSWRGTPQSPLILLDTPRSSASAVLSVGLVACRREHADHGGLRRRQDLHGDAVPADDGKTEAADLDSGAR